MQVPDLKMPSRIRVIPAYNLLLTLRMEEGEFMAQAFTLDSCKYIRSFIKRGPGGGQQLNVYAIQYTNGDKVVYVTDVIKKIIYGYSIDSILKAISVKPVDSIPIKNQWPGRPLIIDQKKVVNFRENSSSTPPIDDYRSVGVYNFFDRSGNLLSYNGKYPSTPKKIDINQLNDAFHGGMNLSEDQTRLIYAYYNTDIIDLSNKNGDLIKRIQGPDNFDPSFKWKTVPGGEKFVSTEGSRFGYSGTPRMNKNVLFVLYNGSIQDSNVYHTARLYQFDSTLVPKVAYTLSEPVSDFDVDWDHRKIYGLTHLKDKQILVFKF
ncbi:MAG TPA: BF3164 family lipoprotein [Puia sp.]|jgi:hypothetical protein